MARMLRKQWLTALEGKHHDKLPRFRRSSRPNIRLIREEVTPPPAVRYVVEWNDEVELTHWREMPDLASARGVARSRSRNGTLTYVVADIDDQRVGQEVYSHGARVSTEGRMR